MKIIDSYGREFAAEGLCEGCDILDYPYGPSNEFADDFNGQTGPSKSRIINRDVELINCHAGFVAEAHYMKRSINARMFAGGTRDILHALTLFKKWDLQGLERDDLANQTVARTVALVRSKCGSAAIKAIADRLMENGELDGEGLAEICVEIYDGYVPHYAAWHEFWPPTRDELRTGRRVSNDITDRLQTMSPSSLAGAWL